MQLLDGLFFTRIRITKWPTALNGRGMDKQTVDALAWKPGSDADEMWLAITEYANSQREAEQLVREKDVA